MVYLPTFKVLCINTSATLGCFHKHICTQWLAQLAVQLAGWEVLVFTPQAQRALDRREEEEEEEEVFRPGVGNPGGQWRCNGDQNQRSGEWAIEPDSAASTDTEVIIQMMTLIEEAKKRKKRGTEKEARDRCKS